jgi:hypothetical protein
MAEEWVAPTIAGVFALSGVIASVIISRKTSMDSSDSDRKPDVNEAWKEADRARAVARLWEDAYYLVRGAFKGYGRRMAERFGDDPAKLDAKERAALEHEPTTLEKKE